MKEETMTYEKIRCFLKICESGSINKAAARLYISQQSLSHTVAAMEEEIGQPLFVRSSKGVTLTAFGEYFREKAQKVADAMDELNEACGTNPHGIKSKIIVGIPRSQNYSSMSAALDRAFTEFSEENRIEIRTVVVDGDYNSRLYEMLRQGEIDAAYSHGPMPDEKIEKTEIQRIAMCLLIPKKNPLSRYRTISLKELRDETFILPPENTGLCHLILERAAEEGFVPKAAEHTGYAKKLVELVSREKGISFIEKNGADGACRLYENLTTVLPDPAFEIIYYLAISSSPAKNSVIRYFVAEIKKKISEEYHYLGL